MKIFLILCVVWCGLAFSARTIYTPGLNTVTSHTDSRAVHRVYIDCRNITATPQTLTVTLDNESYFSITGVYRPVASPLSATISVPGNKRAEIQVYAVCSTFGCGVNICQRNAVVDSACPGQIQPTFSPPGTLFTFLSVLYLTFSVAEDAGAVMCRTNTSYFGTGGGMLMLSSLAVHEVNGGRPF